ncbi:FtsK/SpoIIIE domain-containing protein [Aerococcaceae bacterium NML190073]|nr:FtsK/SpoIIIE domain-containing protein [Aerococcaceae bacterium NML190073]
MKFKIKLFKNKEPTVSLTNRNISWILNCKLVKYLAYIVLMVSVYNLYLYISLWNIVMLIFSIGLVYILQKLSTWIYKRYHLRDTLLYFLRANNLFTDKRIDNQTIVTSSAVLGWKQTENKLIIKAYKQGDSYSKRLENLDTELSALLGLPLENKIIRPSIVEYHFYTTKPTRLLAKNLSATVPDKTTIPLGYGFTYDPSECPHILVAGGTGSGKSIFISFFLLELLRRKSTIYICDPKNSDLGSLLYYLGSERVATSPNNIAKIVRLTIEEMNKRYEYMRENFRYGSNFADHGFNMTWLIFDEMGAFQASGTDKKSKEVINEVMDGIKQIILLGRQAGIFILVSAQQVNADTLNTDLRDNLGLRIALGANSSEGYRMVFGSATPPVKHPIEVQGAGYLYMQGSGKESAEYWESPYLNPKEFDFISELQKLIN